MAQPPEDGGALAVKLEMLVGGDGALMRGEASIEVGQGGAVMIGGGGKIAAPHREIAAQMQPAPVRGLRRQQRVGLIGLISADEQEDQAFEGAAAERLIGGGVMRQAQGGGGGVQIARCSVRGGALKMIAGADLIGLIQPRQRAGGLVQAKQHACGAPADLLAPGGGHSGQR